MAQPWIREANELEDKLCIAAVLLIGSVDEEANQQARRICDNVALTALDLLASVIPSRPPFSVVLTDWESKIAAVG